MACPFLDKLPAELRNKFYSHVLVSDDRPLVHAKHLQPFVKKLTAVEVELPEPYLARELRSLFRLESPSMVRTSILSTSKLIYSEAMKVFYNLNIIKVHIDFLKMPSVTTPTGSDLSLAEHLHIAFTIPQDFGHCYSSPLPGRETRSTLRRYSSKRTLIFQRYRAPLS